MCRRLLLAESVNEEEILEQAFAFFDRDGNKQVSLTELTTVMQELGDLLTTEELAAFVAIMDKNADGVVGVSELTLPSGCRAPGSSSLPRKCILQLGPGLGLQPPTGLHHPA
jgi:hypothetical protein